MKSQFFAAVFAAASLVVSAGPTTESPKILSGIRPPSVEAGFGYRTAKIEYGMVESDESVFDYEIELDWYGLVGGLEVCHDLTGINRRRGRANELESFLGYEYALGDFKAKAAYVNKSVRVQGEPDTQEVELEFAYLTPWVTPVFSIACDTHAAAGALYGTVGLSHEWTLCEGVNLITVGGIGFGNPRHNDWCFARDSWAFREIHLGVELEIELCEHVKLVSGLDLYDAFTADQRRTYDKFNGFIAVAACRLVFVF